MSEHDLEAFIDAKLDDPRTLPYDEAGFAARIIARHGDDMKWCEAKRSWYIWQAGRWTIDQWSTVKAWAIDTADSLHQEADALAEESKAATDNERKRLEKRIEYVRQQVPRWRSDSKIRGALNLAKSWPGVSLTFDEFDGNSWILNTPTGTIDLSTGKLYPHRRSDLCTKVTAAPYDIEAEHPALAQLLTSATGGDVELQSYIQKAFGYSLCGLNPLECLFFVHGPTRSGKTTLLEAVKTALGDYAKSCDFKTFLDKGRAGGGRAGLARLAGARLVGSSEVKRGAKLAEDVLKWISGNDVIVDNEVYEKEIEFRPQFTLWLLANDRPRAAADDDAIWARIKVIPFLYTVPKEKRDPRLKAQLTQADGTVRVGAEELPAAGAAVLQWLVRGFLRWQEEGLDEPEAVRAATEDYRAANDPIASFLEECCHRYTAEEAASLGYEAEVVNQNMRTIYEVWADKEGVQPVPDKVFKSFMELHGHPQANVKRQGKSYRVWTNISIREDAASGYGLHESQQNPYSPARARAHTQEEFTHSTVTSCNRNPPPEGLPDWADIDQDPPF